MNLKYLQLENFRNYKTYTLDFGAHDNNLTILTGEIFGKSEESSLEIFYSESPQKKKNFKKNGVSISHADYIGNFLTVLFQPEDLNILYLSPHLRRRYLDVILSQTEKKY